MTVLDHFGTNVECLTLKKLLIAVLASSKSQK